MIENEEINILLKKAIELWGKEFQFIMLVEETSELFKELSKDLRNPNYINRNKILEEITNVEIMLLQLKIYYNVSKNDTNKIFLIKY